MAVVSNGNPKRMYSWWWDSHISPKNSKWLQENLTDMDSKVKQMIKLIEEDADSFARRAEMYYKKRPELMKLVEEFYRAYRALAERYDHATGVIRHAHRTITEVFPNQAPLVFGDRSPASASTNELDPRTPEMHPPVRAPVDQEELQKDASGVSPSHSHGFKWNGAFTEEPESMSNRRGLKQLNDLLGSGAGRARKGLNFDEGDEKGRNDLSNWSHHQEAQILSESDRVRKAEAEIAALKDALAKVQSEKEASLTQFQQNLERLSNLESEVSRAQEDSRGLNERASRAEAEVQILKETLSKLESEKESSFIQYRQCQNRIADLENSISLAQKDAGEITGRASKAEAETQALKQTLSRAETEKEAALVQYKQCLDTISNLEERLRTAEEDARTINERAGKAEDEVENLKQTVSKLTEEKEASALQYQECLDTIADLKLKLFHAQEEIQRLSREMEDGVAKLKVAEEKCVVLERSNQNLHSELDTLLEKLGNQSQELTEKQKELGRLWTCVQEERLRFLEAETAFQTLQHLHSQSQEELRSLGLELQTRSQILKDMEVRNDSLQEEVQKAKDENKGLNELNLSSAASIKALQEEISSLKETIQKLEAEVELRVDQRNALQQEIYCLKEELNQTGKKHMDMLEQVEFVGLDPDCFGSSVKELQDENSKLKDLSEREKCEKMALFEKLEIMEKLVQKNLLLENSISDLNSELEAIRSKLKSLEEACGSLSEEKSGLLSEKETLTSWLQAATENSERLSEQNKLLEISLSDADAELDGLRLKLKSLEESCHLLNNDKSSLTSERESLVSHVNLMRASLKDLETGHAELKMKVLNLETERESSIQKIEELGLSLDAKDREYASFVQFSQARMGDMEVKIHHLQDEKQCKEREYQEELDRGFDAQMEIFVLQKCLQDLVEKNSSLMVENQKIKESYELSEKLACELEHENTGKAMQIDSLISRIKLLRVGLHHLLMRLEIIPCIDSEDENTQDEKIMDDVLGRVDEMQNMLLEIQDENQHSAVENYVLVALLQQLKSEALCIATEKNTLEEEFKFQYDQLSSLKNKAQQLIDMNGELISKVKQGGDREEALKKEIESLHRQVLDLQGAHSHLQEVNHKILDENRSLTNSTVHLEEEKRKSEDDIALLLSETIYLSSLILVYGDIISQKQSEVKKLSEDLARLHSIKDELELKVEDVDDKLNNVESENSQLKGLLEKSAEELLSVRSGNDQLGHEITNARDCLYQKEKELTEAMLMISMLQKEKTKLSQTVEDLEGKCKEAKAIQEEQEKNILKLHGDYDEQIEATGHVREVNQKLAAELQNRLEELEEIKIEKEKLNEELLKERREVERWESQAMAFFGDMQTSAVHGTLLEGVACGLAEDCERLEGISASKDIEVEQLKGRVNSLEDANQEQRARMAEYAQAVILLGESVRSLEDRVGMHHKPEDEPIEGTRSLANQEADCHTSSEDCFSDLHEMRLRIKAIEEAVKEKEKLAMLENSNSYSKLEVAMKQIEALKTGARTSKRRQERDGRPQKQTRQISQDESEVITKDIMLDQVSDGSSYGISRKDTPEADDQRVELWETTGQGSSLGLKLEKPHKMVRSKTDEGVKEKGKSLSEESLVIDKLEISDRFTDTNQEVKKRKTLERLDSDLQKLANLQITVQDLKNKVEMDDKIKRGGKGDEYETIKEQLEEAEEAIGRLFSFNRKLTTKAENELTPSDGKSADLGENQSNRTRRISEQARKGSEKIGRLQLEIQRIQFLLMKLEGERETRSSRSKIVDSKARVLLRDYIYGGGRRSGQRRPTKKSGFCACVQAQPHSP